MSTAIPPNRKALVEAHDLSEEILRNVELNEFPLANIALKTSRLARLLNEFDFQKIMEYEAGGYPTDPSGVPPDAWRLAIAAGRSFKTTNPSTKKEGTYAYIESISELEEGLRIAETSLAAARDPDVAISSANPQQYVFSPWGNFMERRTIRESIVNATRRLASRRSMIHQYVLQTHYKLKLSGIAGDIFDRIRERVDAQIGALVPDAVQKFSAVYESLRSENPEDWSNAVHSCRRILEDLADALFPPTDDVREKQIDGKMIKIKLGKKEYKNRIMAFVEDMSKSKRFEDLVGSHLAFLGDRLDSVFLAAQKGSHITIVTKEEADRYVVYTYLLVGDILSLRGT